MSRRSCPLQLATVVRDTGAISLVNNSDSLVLINKNSQMADVVACYTINLTKDMAQTIKKIRKIYDVSDNHISHLLPSEKCKDDTTTATKF